MLEKIMAKARGEGTTMTLAYDLYWSFRSPYSYMITPRLVSTERILFARSAVNATSPPATR